MESNNLITSTISKVLARAILVTLSAYLGGIALDFPFLKVWALAGAICLLGRATFGGKESYKVIEEFTEADDDTGD